MRAREGVGVWVIVCVRVCVCVHRFTLPMLRKLHPLDPGLHLKIKKSNVLGRIICFNTRNALYLIHPLIVGRGGGTTHGTDLGVTRGWGWGRHILTPSRSRVGACAHGALG